MGKCIQECLSQDGLRVLSDGLAMGAQDGLKRARVLANEGEHFVHKDWERRA